MQKSRLYFLLKQRRARRMQKTRQTNRVLTGTVKALLAVLLVTGFGIIAVISWEYSRISTNLPSASELATLLDRQNGELLVPTRIYDRTGKTLLAELGTPQSERVFLSLDPAAEKHFSPQLLQTAVAVLEPEYWQGSGIAAANLIDPAPATIAERLVQSVLLANEPDSTLRALRMRLLALQAVHQYGKSQILEWYLNSVFLGHDAYGVEAASQLYLGKSAQDLTLSESALIIGLADFPALNPLDSPAAAVDLQQAVLKKLEESGGVSQADLAASRQEKLPLQSLSPSAASANDAIVELVKNQLAPYLGADRLERGGLVITTTIDADLQAQLQCTSQTQLFRIENSNLSGVASEPSNCQAALLLPTQSFSQSYNNLSVRGIIVDPAAGQVLAYLPPTTQFGETLPDAKAQPGSLLAPVIALASFARGESPASLMWDIPASIPADLPGISNPDAAFHGPVSLRSAIANDYLVPIAQLAEQTGSSVTWQMAESLGLNSVDTPNALAENLFSGGALPLLETSQVYATLANSGLRVGIANPKTDRIDLSVVMRADTTSGRHILDFSSPQHLSIISDALAYLMNNVLSDDAARRPSLGYPNALEINRPSAAKLGETQSRDQIWTAGYTPHRLVIVGIQQQEHASNAEALQPVMAAGIWNAMIQYASANLPADNWNRPTGVTEMSVCSPSGLLPTDACPDVVREVFLTGNEPVYPDNLYRKVEINRETGLLATVFTPADLVEEKVTMDVPPQAREWALAAGLPLTPGGYDAIQTVTVDPQVQISSPALFAAVRGKVEIQGTAADSSFKSYTVQVGEGINPAAWIQVGDVQTKAVSNGILATWDTQGLNGLYAVRLTVLDQANRLKTAVIQVTVDNTPPQAAILSPQADDQISPVMGVITFSARVEDNVSVARMEWWLDGQKVAEGISAPYTYVWQAVAGKHTLMIKAWDNAGNEGTSAAVSFTVTK